MVSATPTRPLPYVDSPAPLPCPHCGWTPIMPDGALSVPQPQLPDNIWGQTGAIQCRNPFCRAIGPIVQSRGAPLDVWRHAAIQAWNRRMVCV